MLSIVHIRTILPDVSFSLTGIPRIHMVAMAQSHRCRNVEQPNVDAMGLVQTSSQANVDSAPRIGISELPSERRLHHGPDRDSPLEVPRYQHEWLGDSLDALVHFGLVLPQLHEQYVLASDCRHR